MGLLKKTLLEQFHSCENWRPDVTIFLLFPSMLTTNALLQSVQISDDNHYFADQTEERHSH